MKSKLLPLLLITLILLNGVLIFMLVKKPHNNRQHKQQRSFLTSQLGFSKDQKDKFIDLDAPHRRVMMELDERIKKNKEILFNSFSEVDFKADEIIREIGDLEYNKETEVFRFFSKVRALCNDEQIKIFDKTIKNALKVGNRKPPRREEGNLPQRGDRRMPPPR